MRSWVRLLPYALLTLAAAVLVAIPAAITLTPAQQTTIAGQQVGIGATTPRGGWLGGWRGPAQLQQIGETVVDLGPVRVRGPLRPRLQLGPVTRTDDLTTLLDPRDSGTARSGAVTAITTTFRDWYLLATVLLILITIGLIGVATTVRIWWVMARASRRRAQTHVAEVWHQQARRMRTTAVVGLGGTLVVWGCVGLLAAHDTRAGLAGVSSLRDLVGAAPVKLRPAGPSVSGYAGAVIGDSRAARLGGRIAPDADKDAVACKRSTDSLAAQLSRLSDTGLVRNLACSGATIEEGLLGRQHRGHRAIPPQVSKLMSMPPLDYVVVMIGPNDLDWTAFLKYCYAFPRCDDRVSDGQFTYRLAAFDRAYGDLLAALDALPGHPDVVMVGSYDVFAPGAHCASTAGPAGVSGLDSHNIALLRERNAELNSVLQAGAAAYDFGFVQPHLAPLCQQSDPEVGPDLQGLDDAHPFHPTGIGMVRLAASVFAALPAPAQDDR